MTNAAYMAAFNKAARGVSWRVRNRLFKDPPIFKDANALNAWLAEQAGYEEVERAIEVAITPEAQAKAEPFLRAMDRLSGQVTP